VCCLQCRHPPSSHAPHARSTPQALVASRRASPVLAVISSRRTAQSSAGGARPSSTGACRGVLRSAVMRSVPCLVRLAVAPLSTQTAPLKRPPPPQVLLCHQCGLAHRHAGGGAHPGIKGLCTGLWHTHDPDGLCDWGAGLWCYRKAVSLFWWGGGGEGEGF